jgi:hypothetical protein
MCEYKFVCMRALTNFHVPALTYTEERARKRERLLKSLEAIEVEHEHHATHREHEREVRQEHQVCLRELGAFFFFPVKSCPVHLLFTRSASDLPLLSLPSACIRWHYFAMPPLPKKGDHRCTDL